MTERKGKNEYPFRRKSVLSIQRCV